VSRSATTVHRRRVVRIGDRSLLWRPRPVVLGAGLGAAALVLVAVSVTRGDFTLPLVDVLAVLAGGGDPTQQLVVLELRLPRALTGALVGAALGMAGAVTQSVTRNPLGSPDVLGITYGAGAAAVAVITLAGTGAPAVAASWSAAPWSLPAAAVLGGLLTAMAVYLLAWRDGVDGYRLVLVGIGIGALCAAVTSWLLIRADIVEAARASVWLTGSLNGRGWEHVTPLAVTLAVTGAALLAAGNTLGLLAFGEDTTRALGVRVQTGRAVVIVLAVVLTSVATAAAGPVAFVALVAPQIAVRLIRAATPPLAISALTGAVLLLLCDLTARTALPVELPVGVVTAVVGAPYLIYLLLVSARKVAA
jgi:iron complex transport system permease protein